MQEKQVRLVVSDLYFKKLLLCQNWVIRTKNGSKIWEIVVVRMMII